MPRPLEEVAREFLDILDKGYPPTCMMAEAKISELREALAERMKNPVPLAQMIEALDRKVSLLIDNRV